jgi:ABC-type polysaccharide/polyol phosphate export permease
MTEHSADFELIIRPKYSILDLNWQELREYRELLFFLALREIKIRYKQTIMGASWALLQPFFTMIIFTLVFINTFTPHFAKYAILSTLPASAAPPSTVKIAPHFCCCSAIQKSSFVLH